MRSRIKQFESICQEHELNWNSRSRSAVSDFIHKYSVLLDALRPFVEAAKHIPAGALPNDDIGCIPRSCFCVGDFYKLLDAVEKGT